jgi:hypothetical protein
MVGEQHSKATSLGMRKWWESKPLCKRCQTVKIRNPYTGMLCAKCKKKSNREKHRWQIGEEGNVLIFFCGQSYRGRLRKTDRHSWSFVGNETILLLHDEDFSLLGPNLD